MRYELFNIGDGFDTAAVIAIDKSRPQELCDQDQNRKIQILQLPIPLYRKQ